LDEEVRVKVFAGCCPGDSIARLAALCDEGATMEDEVSLVATLHGTFCGGKR
jgi:hypothetical protein